MTRTFNLANQPWIGVYTTTGATTLSLADTLGQADRIREVATGNPLADAAINHLLLAIHIDSRGDHRTWINKHHHLLDLFDRDLPFGQYAALAHRKNPQPVSDLLYNFDTASASFSSYDSIVNPTTGLTLTPAEAAQLLLVRNHFQIGGLQSKQARAITGLGSAWGALWGNYPVIMPRTGTLAADLELAATAALADKPHLGTLHLSFPIGVKLGSEIDNPGLLDVLTYPSRVHMLAADEDGTITGGHAAEGLRLTAENLTPQLMPTTWTTDKKGAHPRKIHLARPAWQQMLDHYIAHPGGMLDNLPPGTPITMTSMAAYTSRIDGLFHQRTVTPTIGREEAEDLAKLVAEVRKRIYGDNHIVAGNLTGGGSVSHDSFADTLTSEARPQVTADLGKIATARMAGSITAHQAQEQARRLVETNRARAHSHLTAKPTAAIDSITRFQRTPWKGPKK